MAAKSSYQHVPKQNQEIKQYISDIKKEPKKNNSNSKCIRGQKIYIKILFIKQNLIVKLNKTNKKYRVLRKYSNRIMILKHEQEQDRNKNNS